MARPKVNSNTLVVRVPDETIEEIDSLTEMFRFANRSEVIREAVALGIKQLKKEKSKKE